MAIEAGRTSNDDASRVRVVTSPVGNLATFDLAGRALERVSLASDDLAKRVLRLTCATFDVGVRLAPGTTLRDGDVVYADDARAIAIRVESDAVLVCRPVSIAQALAVAHAIGNRHWPMQVEGDALVLRDDRLAAELLAELGATYAREYRTLAQPFRHARAPHGHDAE